MPPGTALVLRGAPPAPRVAPADHRRAHTRLPEPCELHGLPVAPVARAVIDTVRYLSDVDDVRALLAEAVQRGFTSPRALRHELETGS